MTVITVVAIAAVAAIFYAFVWPAIQHNLSKNTCANSCGCKANVTSVDKETGACVCANENFNEVCKNTTTS